MNTNNDEMTTNNSDKYFEMIDNLDSIRDHKNLDVYDTLVPLWIERKNCSKAEIKLMIAIHELHQSYRLSTNGLFDTLCKQQTEINELRETNCKLQTKINEICDKMSK